MKYPKNETKTDVEALLNQDQKLRRRGLLSLALVISFVWLCFMPVHWYRPYCDPQSVELNFQYYSPHLSQVYRDALLYGLDNGGDIYLEIGDRVLVPVLSTGVYLDKTTIGKRMFYAIYYLMFGRTTATWSNKNGKVALSAIASFSKANSESHIADMRRQLSAARFGGNPERLDHDQKQKLECDLVKAITDPSIDTYKGRQTH